jgi:anthranilate phosphoribosyltransferase
VLRQLGTERAWVVHGRDGMDELTVFAPTHVAEVDGQNLREFEVDPVALGLAHQDRAGVAGGDAASNAAKIRAVLGGEKGAGRDVVLLNTGAALVVAGVAPTLEEGVRVATEAIDRGKAKAMLEELATFRG